jgi:predicted ATPase
MMSSSMAPRGLQPLLRNSTFLRINVIPRATQRIAIRTYCSNTWRAQGRAWGHGSVPRTVAGFALGRSIRTQPGGYREHEYIGEGGQEKAQNTPMKEYDARVDSGRLRDDDHQRGIIQDLEDLHTMLSTYTQPAVQQPTIASMQPPKKSFFSSLFSSSKSPRITLPPIPESLPKGLYMYGDVGSGKTMLMDLLYDTLPPNITKKTRIHFHAFMQSVHKDLHKMKMLHGNEIDAIPYVAAHIAQDASVLCFDEFQCTDVADAMILRRLIESLMAHGTVVVTTSNRHPDDLYKNGIQRESFVPAINLLKSNLKVLNLDSDTDYRKIPRPPSGVYHHPLDKAANTHAERWFKFMGDIQNDPPHAASHTVWGREIEVPKASGRCAWFTFDQIIGRATGAADYLELMRNYDAFIITDVPGMNSKSRDLARRFITFIDAIYESRVSHVHTVAMHHAY